jgi:hypothetical protein
MARKLVAFFGCTVDLAATQETNVLGPMNSYLGPDRGEEALQDALRVDWHTLKGHRVGFLNPPFSLEEIKELREIAESRAVPDLEARINALRIEQWAWKACDEAMKGFQTIGVFPYSPQTEWFKNYVLGFVEDEEGRPAFWGGGAYEYWVLPHRVSFLAPDGSKQGNAGVNTCVVNWKPNPGFYGSWVPPMRYWSYR